MDYVNNTTILSGVECKLCGNILPDHTIKQHRDLKCSIHKCPHVLKTRKTKTETKEQINSHTTDN